ncbi:MAG: recombinase family protein [Marinosulfonomonas sp.]|nr:recombinase family protein [Marinosulfonomonas sp.]
MKVPARRCALYTRKSSEEGLDQAFNSLDAQREAGEAYVVSQKAEGWRALPDTYDDGGFSGGSMERPALKRLLSDVEAGRVDVIIVYKIDRLTRALADFARMLEIFDRHDVSFVSVTQSFNTTSSMGRLTLNVLLSFAQFEREVTGERIRDKIAASKAKGMWMGGYPPLGYDLPAPETRKLIVNPAEAETVRLIYRRYLDLASVHTLERWLIDQGIRSKRHVTKKGRIMGDQPFSRGALFHLLKNRLYLGEIVHRGVTNPGLHDAIIDQPLFAEVQQALLHRSRRRRSTREKVAKSPLAGRIFDSAGNPMSPTFSYGARGKLYRYYVSAPLQQGKRSSEGETLRRVSAAKLEAAVRMHLKAIMGNAESAETFECITRLIIGPQDVQILIPIAKAPEHNGRLPAGVSIQAGPVRSDQVWLTLPIAFGGQNRCSQTGTADTDAPAMDQKLINALKRAHTMIRRDDTGLPVIERRPQSPHERRLIQLAFLDPGLQRDILMGRQPRSMTLAKFLKEPLPLLWSGQIAVFG